MQCGAARKHLYLLRNPGSEASALPVAAGAAQAQAHVAACTACQEFFAAEQRLGALLQARAPRDKALVSFRERVLSAVTRQRRRDLQASRWSRLTARQGLIVAAASLLVIATVAALWFSQRRARFVEEPLASVLIEDHAHTQPSEAQIASSNNDEVQSWFEGRVGFSFRLPPLQYPSLTGGRLCNLQGRLAALVYYQHPQSRVSLFVLDASDVKLPEDRLIALDGKRCLVDTKKGYNAVLWKERGLVYGLVSDVRSSDLLQLAAQF